MELKSALLAANLLVAQASGSATPGYYAGAPIVEEQGIDWQRYAPVAASLVVPGSGQMLQKDWERGLVHLGFAAACLAASAWGQGQPDGTFRVAGNVGLIAIGLWSPWTALVKAAEPRAEGSR